MPTVDLPAKGLIVQAGVAYIDSPDALASPDTSSAGYVNWLGGSLSHPSGGRNFDLASLPEGAAVQSVELVTVAYRESGAAHPSPDLSDHYSSSTYPTVNVRWAGDGTNFAGYRLEPLPIGAYAGETTAPLPSTQWKYVIAGWPGQRDGFAGLGVDIFAGPGDIMASSILVHIAYLALRVTYTGPGGGITGAPPLRLFPRDDINGARGGPPLRLFPRPSSRQRSNRLSGYL